MTPEDAALRELFEETGYVGKVKGVPSPPISLSPGLTNERVCIVQVEVDMTLPENQTPKQQRQLSGLEHVSMHFLASFWPIFTFRRLGTFPTKQKLLWWI